MKRLPDEPTVGQVREFLAAVEPKTDDSRLAKLNKQLTRRQAWEIFRGGTEAMVRDGNLKDSDPLYPAWSTHGQIIVRNINREFGTGKVME